MKNAGKQSGRQISTKQQITRLIIEQEWHKIAERLDTDPGSRLRLLKTLAELGLPYKHLPSLSLSENLCWFLSFISSSKQSHSKKVPWYEFDPANFITDSQLISLEEPLYSSPKSPPLKKALANIAAYLGDQFSTYCIFPSSPTELFLLNYLAPQSNIPVSSATLKLTNRADSEADVKQLLTQLPLIVNIAGTIPIVTNILIDLFANPRKDLAPYYTRALTAVQNLSLTFSQSITRLFIISNTLLNGSNASTLALNGSMQNMINTFIAFCIATQTEAKALYAHLFFGPVMPQFKFDLDAQEQLCLLTWIQDSRAKNVAPEDLALMEFGRSIGLPLDDLTNSSFQANATREDLELICTSINDHIRSTGTRSPFTNRASPS